MAGSWKSTRVKGGGFVVLVVDEEMKSSRRSVCGMADVSKGSAKRRITTMDWKLGAPLMPSAMPLILSRRSMVLPLYCAPSSKKTNYKLGISD